MVHTHNMSGSLYIYNTSAVFTSTNPILKLGQIGSETDTTLMKRGDGVSTWANLTYFEYGFEMIEASGTDTYTGNLNKNLFLAYFALQRIRVRFTNANTGASTINLNGLGAIAIRKNVSTALASGDLVAGGIYTLHYDGTNFQLEAPSGSAGAGTVTTVSVVTNQGVSGTVANATTTPAITLTLGALTGVTSFNGLVITANTGVITTGTWNATLVGTQYGGTGANNTGATVGAVPYYSSSTVQTFLAATATAGKMLRSGASAAPTWSTNTWESATGVGQILYATSANVIGSASDFVRLTTGELLVGYVTVGIEQWGFQKNQNAASWLGIVNTTSGTAGRAGIILGNSSAFTTSISIQALSAGFTTSGMRIANTAVIQTNLSAGFNIGTNASTQFSIWTDTTKRVEISAVGNMSLGGVATRATTVGTNAMSIFDGTAMAGTLANGVSLQSISGKLKSIDASGLIGWVLASSAVTTVNPTSPNRTLTVEHNGTTYYIHCKTTND